MSLAKLFHVYTLVIKSFFRSSLAVEVIAIITIMSSVKFVPANVLFRVTNQQQQQPQQTAVPRPAAATQVSTPPVAATQGPSQRPPISAVNSTSMGSYPRPPAAPSSAAAAAGAATSGRPASESSTRCSVCSQVLMMSTRRVCSECRRDVCPQCSTSSAPADVRIFTYSS